MSSARALGFYAAIGQRASATPPYWAYSPRSDMMLGQELAAIIIMSAPAFYIAFSQYRHSRLMATICLFAYLTSYFLAILPVISTREPRDADADDADDIDELYDELQYAIIGSLTATFDTLIAGNILLTTAVKSQCFWSVQCTRFLDAQAISLIINNNIIATESLIVCHAICYG